MNFLEYLNIGIEKASQSDQAVREVDQIFNDLNEDLKNYEIGTLKISRVEDVSVLGIFSKIGTPKEIRKPDYFKQDTIFIFLTSGNQTRQSRVAGWSQSMKGYPCILKFNNQELICNTAKQLINGLQALLSSIEFGNVLYKLSKELRETNKEEHLLISDKSLSEEKLINNTNRSQGSHAGSEYKSTTKSKAVNSKSTTAIARAPAKAAASKAPAKAAASKAPAKAAASKAPAKAAAPKAPAKAAASKAPAKAAASKAPAKAAASKAPAKAASAKAKTSSSEEK